MAKNLEEFVNINCCNQMGERAKFIEIIQSLEVLVGEAYEEGRHDKQFELETGEEKTYQTSKIKEKLNKLLEVE